MSDGLKSSYELALERLRARGGADGAPPLSDAQKEAIARVRADYRARRAELDVLNATAVEKARAAGDEEKLKQLAEEHARECAGLEAKEEAAVREIRGS